MEDALEAARALAGRTASSRIHSNIAAIRRIGGLLSVISICYSNIYGAKKQVPGKRHTGCPLPCPAIFLWGLVESSKMMYNRLHDFRKGGAMPWRSMILSKDGWNGNSNGRRVSGSRGSSR
jgi:hypothetical protein